MSNSSGVPRRSALRPRTEVAVSRVVEKRLGALSVVAGFLRRLDVAGTVDRACPIGERALSTHGQIVEALVANRLTSPLPLQHISHWAREWAVEEVFGLSADILNDDRLARALDAIAPNLEGIVGSVGARAIDVFGLDVTRLHWDMTSMSLHGAYEETEEDYPAPAYACIPQLSGVLGGVTGHRCRSGGCT
jgi:hypothetical protein